MATATLVYLTYLGVILLIALLCSIISQKLKIPNILLLVLTGIVINHIPYAGGKLIEFPTEFLTSIAILALVMIVFDSTSKLKLKEVDDFFLRSLEITITFLIVNILLLSVAAYFILEVNVLPALIFASLMTGTSPSVVLTLMAESKNKVIELLKIEALINTPVTVIIPLLLLSLMNDISAGTSAISDGLSSFITYEFVSFLQQIIAGLGAGVLVGLIVFKAMRAKYSDQLSPIAIIAAALLAHVLAENLGGSGVLAVTTLGLLFGKITLRQKEHILDFSTIFSKFLEILVFVFVGLLITLTPDPWFYLQSIGLFAIYLLIRFVSVYITLRNEYKIKQVLFMTLNVPKGIAVAVVVFTILAGSVTVGLETVLNVAMMFLVYSIILATVVARLSKYFLGTTIVK
ncbi:cation:proton antiporter [Nanoarchaeota archaeon]